MRRPRPNRGFGLICLLAMVFTLGGTSIARAQGGPSTPDDASSATQPAPAAKPTYEIYGFAILDIGRDFKQINPNTPIVGKPVPIVGIVAFVDHSWNEKFTSTVGYSWQENDNTEAQAPSAFRTGHYALGNLFSIELGS